MVPKQVFVFCDLGVSFPPVFDKYADIWHGLAVVLVDCRVEVDCSLGHIQ